MSGRAIIVAAQSSAGAPSSIKERLIGTWHMVSLDEPEPDGKIVHHTDRQGMLVYTADGHWSVQLMYPASEIATFVSTPYAERGYEATYGTCGPSSARTCQCM